ncbi:hypothetical protein [Flavobacterium sp.]|uniref:hypothetical protein n=1 Tax=Flavobacterium sp. TaxID=239 RepID=UPI00391AB9ED
MTCLSYELGMMICSLAKVHVKWIICENYTPNGVVVVDVVAPKATTKVLVVKEN